MLSQLPQIQLIQSAHWLAERFIRQLGYTLDLRRSGDLKIGLWRRKWKRKKSGTDRLVIIPGFGDSPLSWMLALSLLKPIIQKHYDEIIFVDFPGFAGFLSKEKAFHSVDLMQTTLFDILDTLKPKTLFGHSLGGWLASLYAVECGEQIRPKTHPNRPSSYGGPSKIILCNASGVFCDEATAQEMQDRFKSAVKDKQKGFQMIRPHVFSKEPFWFNWLHSQYSRFFESAEIEQFIHSAEASHIIQKERLPKIRAQVWLIWGEHDTLIPPSAIPVWMEALGPEKCKALIIKNCGHMPHVEAPATLVWLLSRIIGTKTVTQTDLNIVPKTELNFFTDRFWKTVESA